MLLALAFVVLVVSGDDTKPVPSYTNQDLDRMAPLRGQTGVTSVPVPPAAEAREKDPEPERTTRGEAYWRKEAERTRVQVQRLRDQLDMLKQKMEERERMPGVRRLSDRQMQAWERAAGVLEQRIRDAEARLDDRARREGARPGWLR